MTENPSFTQVQDLSAAFARLVGIASLAVTMRPGRQKKPLDRE
jgi:hypothetical protein